MTSPVKFCVIFPSHLPNFFLICLKASLFCTSGISTAPITVFSVSAESVVKGSTIKKSETMVIFIFDIV